MRIGALSLASAVTAAEAVPLLLVVTAPGAGPVGILAGLGLCGLTSVVGFVAGVVGTLREDDPIAGRGACLSIPPATFLVILFLMLVPAQGTPTPVEWVTF